MVSEHQMKPDVAVDLRLLRAEGHNLTPAISIAGKRIRMLVK